MSAVDRLYWEEMCKRNNHAWMLTYPAWCRYWEHPSQGLLIDPERRGFILYFESKSDDIVDIYFALVDKCHRGKGVLSAMMKRLEQKFPGFVIRLEVIVGRSPIDLWKHFGFVSKTSQYVIGDHIIMEKQL